MAISIHASREGSDSHPRDVEPVFYLFQSTLPAGEATRSGPSVEGHESISIHASRGGSDYQSLGLPLPPLYFNPRFPRGKRHLAISGTAFRSAISIHASRGGSDDRRKQRKVNCDKFQSTLPAGEATNLRYFLKQVFQISIHASRGGSDIFLSIVPRRPIFQSTLPAGEATLLMREIWPTYAYFNPRFPWGKRQRKDAALFVWGCISIHASRGGSDASNHSKSNRKYISIHASRGGSDVPISTIRTAITNFNPRFPRGKRHSRMAGLQFISISIHASRGGSDTAEWY